MKIKPKTKPELKLAERGLAHYIQEYIHAHKTGGLFAESQQKTADNMGTSRPTINRLTKALVEAEVLKTETPLKRKPNGLLSLVTYRLIKYLGCQPIDTPCPNGHKEQQGSNVVVHKEKQVSMASRVANPPPVPSKNLPSIKPAGPKKIVKKCCPVTKSRCSNDALPGRLMCAECESEYAGQARVQLARRFQCPNPTCEMSGVDQKITSLFGRSKVCPSCKKPVVEVATTTNVIRVETPGYKERLCQ